MSKDGFTENFGLDHVYSKTKSTCGGDDENTLIFSKYKIANSLWLHKNNPAIYMTLSKTAMSY